MNALSGALEQLVDASRAWLKCVVGPIGVLNDMLPRANDERHISEATKIWIPSILVSLIVSLPVLNSYGIKWDNLGYHLFNWLVTILNLLMASFLIHWFLICFKLKSEFVRTFVIVTTPGMAYSPIMSLAVTPALFRMLDALQAAKNAKQPFTMAFQYHYVTARLEQPGVLYVILNNSSLILGMICFVLSAEAASQWYGNDRLKTYLATTLASLVGLIASMGAMMMQLWAMYSFMSAN